MPHLFQNGVAVVAGNGVLAIGLVLWGRALRGRVRSPRNTFTSPEFVIGGICFGLAVLDLVVAVGPGRHLPVFSSLSMISSVDFLVSAICYAICGGALVLSVWRTRHGVEE